MRKVMPLLLILCIEFIYFLQITLRLNLIATILTAFVAIYIIPGLLLLLVITKKSFNHNILTLAVEGFFISVILSSVIPIFFLLVNIQLTSINIFSVILCVVLFLLVILYQTNKNIIIVNVSKFDVLLLAIVGFFMFSSLLIFLSLPRLFTPDETLYIYSARNIIFGSFATPVGDPQTSILKLVLEGRILWYSQVAFFIVVTNIPPYKSGLFGIYFMAILAMAPSLFFDESEKDLLLATSCIMLTTPILISFFGFVLNDLALSFFIFLAIMYFIKSFSRASGLKRDFIIIDENKIIQSFLVTSFVFLIKPNILFIFPMWLYVSYIFLTKRNTKSCETASTRFIKVFVFVPLFYEIFLDLPFFIIIWVFKNKPLATTLGKIILVSPITKFAKAFSPSPFYPNTRTFLTLPAIDIIDKFYRLISPEAINILSFPVIVIAPLIFLIIKGSNKVHIKLKYTILLIIIELSFWSFYLLTYRMFGDIPRYSLWMVPLIIILIVKLIKLAIHRFKVIFLLLLITSELTILYLNLFITSIKGGVFVGYIPSSRVYTFNILFCFILLFLMTVITLLTFLLNQKTSITKFRNLLRIKIVTIIFLEKKFVRKTSLTFFIIIIMIIITNLYFATLLFHNNMLYTDHGLIKINNNLTKYKSHFNSSLIFANNYLYLRSYVDTSLLKQNILLPLPDTNESTTQLFDAAPQGSLFLISSDPKLAWFSYNDRYMRKYSDSDIITPETKKIEKYPNITLINRLLYMPFDDANSTYTPDHSTYDNSGTNHYVEVTNGVWGSALKFNGSAYISINNTSLFDFNTSITISFFALIEKAEPHKGYMIISKGYGYFNGSFSILVHNTFIYFDLGNVGRLKFSALPYVGSWHHYLFIYNNHKIMAFVDGVLAGVTYGEGQIKKTNFPLEIGRDSERGDYYFIGKLDELQISPLAIDVITVANAYFDSYAVRVKTIPLQEGNCSIFKLIHKEEYEKSLFSVTSHITSIIFSLSLLDNRSIALTFEMKNNGAPANITILASTEKATKVFKVATKNGKNSFTIIIPFEQTAWSYWYYSSTIKIVLLSQRRIFYRTVLHITNFKFIYLSLLLILLHMLVGYFVVVNNQVKSYLKNIDKKGKHSLVKHFYFVMLL